MQDQNDGVAAVLAANTDPLLDAAQPHEHSGLDSVWRPDGERRGNLPLPTRASQEKYRQAHDPQEDRSQYDQHPDSTDHVRSLAA